MHWADCKLGNQDMTSSMDTMKREVGMKADGVEARGCEKKGRGSQQLRSEEDETKSEKR